MAPQLPPLNAVRVFALVAQRLNFARAAEELGVTQSAVSKQIQLLEEYIGTKLFERRSAGVALTMEGRELREAVVPAIDALAVGFERYRRRPPRSEKLRITTTASFAALVLLPGLPEFEASHPGTAIEILTGDRLFDLEREEVDFAIRFGPGPWSAEHAEPLGAHELVPVASPHLLHQFADDPAEALCRAPKIQTFARDEWRDFSGVMGITLRSAAPQLVLENFFVAISAVRLGRGAALLPACLLGDDVSSGRLMTIGEPLPWAEGFALLRPSHRPLSPRAAHAAAWITGLV